MQQENNAKPPNNGFLSQTHKIFSNPGPLFGLRLKNLFNLHPCQDHIVTIFCRGNKLLTTFKRDTHHHNPSSKPISAHLEAKNLFPKWSKGFIEYSCGTTTSWTRETRDKKLPNDVQHASRYLAISSTGGRSFIAEETIRLEQRPIDINTCWTIFTR